MLPGRHTRTLPGSVARVGNLSPHWGIFRACGEVGIFQLEVGIVSMSNSKIYLKKKR